MRQLFLKNEQIVYLFFVLLFFSCSSEKRENQTADNKSNPSDSTLIDSLANENASKSLKDSVAQTKAIDSATVKEEENAKEKYPNREFSINVDGKNAKYLAYEWAITFFVKNGRLDELKSFRNLGFPMEWWAGGMCSFYPVPVDSVSYFLRVARKHGYKDYGFDCKKVGDPTFSAALSNTVILEVNSGFNMNKFAKKHQLEFVKKIAYRSYLIKTINLNAQQLIVFVEKLNQEEGVKKASFKFATCEETPLH